MASLPLLANAQEYNQTINITPPKVDDFDVRSFVENMETVRLSMPPFRLGFYQMALLETGGGKVIADGKEKELGEHTLFFNLPGQIIYWDVPNDWRGYYFNLSESYYTVPLEGYPRLAQLPYFRKYTPAIALTKEEAEQLRQLFGLLHQEYGNPSSYLRPVTKGLINGLLAYALKIYDRATEEHTTHHSQAGPAERFRLLVRERVTAMALGLGAPPLGVGEIAAELFVSPQHLSAVVKEATGRSPKNFIQNLLVEEAKKLLRATELSVSEIADQLAFNDPAYFSRVFKNMTGQSPGNFRKVG